MALAHGDVWKDAVSLRCPTIDHVGYVVPDVYCVVRRLRDKGFEVCEPVELLSPDGTLGQVSAHCIFQNAYLEISAPIQGMRSHLKPLLNNGAGLRLLLFRSQKAITDIDEVRRAGFECSGVNEASRQVSLPGGQHVARFRWFEVPALIPGVIAGYVEHLDPDIVFNSALMRHPNGARKIEAVLFGSDARAIARLPARSARSGPEALFAPAKTPAIAGLLVTGERSFKLEMNGSDISVTEPLKSKGQE